MAESLSKVCDVCGEPMSGDGHFAVFVDQGRVRKAYDVHADCMPGMLSGAALKAAVGERAPKQPEPVAAVVNVADDPEQPEPEPEPEP